MRAGVIANPASGRDTGGRHAGRVKACLEGRGVASLDLTGATAADSAQSARDAARLGLIDLLLAVGGDGTVHAAVDALAGTGVPLGIVAVGSGNDIAREFDLPIRRPEESTALALDLFASCDSRPVDAMEVSSRGVAHRALAVVSAGIDAAINLRTNSLAWPPGTLRYVRGALATLRGFSPYGVRVEVDGRAAAGLATLVAVANTKYFGGGMNIAPPADPGDGLLDVVVAKDLSTVQILALLPRLYSGGHVAHPNVHVLRGRRIRICDVPGLGAPALIAMADGEVLGPPPVDVRCLPGALELLA